MATTTGKKIKKRIAMALGLRKRRVYPDMPSDPKELARAIFWENDHKRFAKERRKESR